MNQFHIIEEKKEINELKQKLEECKHLSSIRRLAVEALIVTRRLSKKDWQKALQFVGSKPA